MADPALRIVFCNCSSSESDSLARRLVKSELAACVNVIPSVKSYYVWEGELCVETEHTLLIKTTNTLYAELEERLAAWHSYEVPEIVAVSPSDVLPEYRAWVFENVRSRASP